MKRRRLLITGVLLLLGGAIVNVAVAWAFGRWTYFSVDSFSMAQQAFVNEPETVDAQTGERRGPPGLSMHRFKQMGAERLVVQPARYTQVDWSHLPGGVAPSRPSIDELWPWWGPLGSSSPREVYEGNLRVSLGYAARGWPVLCLWCEFQHGHGQVSGGIAFAGLNHTPNTFITTERVLPLRPIWRGFVINTIFYAAILWAVFSVPGMVRRRIRRRRGLCPACAYPIGTSPVCTECGAAIPGVQPRRGDGL